MVKCMCTNVWRAELNVKGEGPTPLTPVPMYATVSDFTLHTVSDGVDILFLIEISPGGGWLQLRMVAVE